MTVEILAKQKDAWAGLRLGKAFWEFGMRLQDYYPCNREKLGKNVAKGKELSKNEKQFLWGQSFWAQGILMMIEAEKELEKADENYKHASSMNELMEKIGSAGIYQHY